MSTTTTINPANNNNKYNIPNLSGKTAIITGGNSGLGLKTALELVRNQADVIITCRSASKGEEAVAQIKQELENEAAVGTIDYGICDLCDLVSIKTFVDTFSQNHTQLDILVANAGISTQTVKDGKHQLTPQPDNQEILFQANYLGHFAMIQGFMPLLLASSGTARIASCNTGFLMTEYMANPIDLTDINWTKRAAEGKFNLQQAYFSARLAQQQMTVKLNQEFQKQQATANSTPPPAIAICFEPNLVKRREPDSSAIMEYLRVPIDEGCKTHLRAATDPSVKANDFLEPHRFFFFGGPTTYSLEDSKMAGSPQNQNAIDQLWDLSNEIVQQAWK